MWETELENCPTMIGRALQTSIPGDVLEACTKRGQSGEKTGTAVEKPPEHAPLRGKARRETIVILTREQRHSERSPLWYRRSLHNLQISDVRRPVRDAVSRCLVGHSRCGGLPIRVEQDEVNALRLTELRWKSFFTLVDRNFSSKGDLLRSTMRG